MTRWLFLLSALMVSSASASVVTQILTMLDEHLAEITSEKPAMTMMFGQCNEVNQILDIQNDRNLTLLSVDFVTKNTKAQFKLTELSAFTSSELFKPDERLIIYFHGFTDDKMSSRMVIDNLVETGAGNVLALDASPIIDSIYLRPRTLVRFIGEEMGKALAEMIEAGLDPAAIHLVGHSLGSHIAGFAGKTLLDLTGYRVRRISGLDPAGRCFDDVNETQRLSKNDADYVDVIHTDSGMFGMEEPLGHADYYPNRGTEQPGCISPVCSHDRAWMYFYFSLTYPRGFPAIKCHSWKDFQEGNCDPHSISLMGYGSQPGTEGRYYLQTADRYPYLLGFSGIKYVNTN